MRALLLILVLSAAAPAAAQVHSRPTAPPIVTAENETWFQQGEPLQLGNDVYYPAGARVFFNGNTMVRTAHYNGVPLYADTTIEPFSIVYVPIGRGIMQPYERPRRGELAGTTGSRTPSFPGEVPPAYRGPIMAAVSPTNLSLPEPLDLGAADAAPAAAQQSADPVVSVLRPESNDGVWIYYAGVRWLSAGPAVPLRAADFELIGDYAGFPVFGRRGSNEQVIYVPSRAGLIAPYRRK
jgi:hypothetical protein